MSANLVLTGTGAGAVKSVGDLQKAFDKLEKGIELSTKEAKALEVAAGRVAKSNEAPLERYNRKVDELAKLHRAGKISAEDHAKATERLTQQFENAGKAGERAFGAGAASSIKNYITGLLTVQTVLGEVKGEIDSVIKAAAKATQAKMDVSGAESTLRENLTGASRADRAKVLAGSEQIAKDLKLDQAAVHLTLADTYASAGSPERALDIARTAGQLTRDPAKLRMVGGGIADVMTASGIESAKEALGFGLIAQGESRITDTGKFFESLSKVTAGVTAPNTGGTPQAAAGLLAAISKGSADTTGEQSRTAAITLSQKLDAFFDKQKGGENFNTDQEMAALLGNRELAKKFIDSNTFEAGASGAISKMLLEDGATRNAYIRAHGATGDPNVRVRTAEDAFGFVREGNVQRTAGTENAIQNTMQQMRLRGDGELSTDSRDAIIDLQYKLHGGLRRSASMDISSRTGFTMSRGEAIQQLERIGGGAEPMPWAFGAARGEDRESALKEIAGLLGELRNIEEQHLQETRSSNGSGVGAPQPWGNGEAR